MNRKDEISLKDIALGLTMLALFGALIYLLIAWPIYMIILLLALLVVGVWLQLMG